MHADVSKQSAVGVFSNRFSNESGRTCDFGRGQAERIGGHVRAAHCLNPFRSCKIQSHDPKRFMDDPETRILKGWFMGHLGLRKTILMNTPRQTASDRDFVGALLDFANGHEIELRQGLDNGHAVPSGDLAELRGEIRDQLDLAATKPKEFMLRYGAINGQIITSVLSSAKPINVLEIRARGLKLIARQEFPDLKSAMNYGLLLLLDIFGPFANVLSRCKLPRCSCFYLARKHPKGGRANKTYCSVAHRNEAHDSKLNRTPRKAK